MKVAIAATFRHRPEQDGSLIPASRIERAGVFAGHVVPAIGYVVAIVEGGKPFWSFGKYEAMELNRPPKPVRPANFATCRVDWVKCPECGANAPFPAPGKNDRMKGKCPFCGSSSAIRTPVKEDSDQFRRMLGDLADPLLQEAEAALRGDGEYAGLDGVPPDECEGPFPRLLIGAPDGAMEPDPAVPPAIQGLAQAKGRVLRLVGGMTAGELPSTSTGPMDWSIVPEIRACILDDDVVRAGWTRVDGLLTQYVRLPLPRLAAATVTAEVRY